MKGSYRLLLSPGVPTLTPGLGDRTSTMEGSPMGDTTSMCRGEPDECCVPLHPVLRRRLRLLSPHSQLGRAPGRKCPAPARPAAEPGIGPAAERPVAGASAVPRLADRPGRPTLGRRGGDLACALPCSAPGLAAPSSPLAARVSFYQPAGVLVGCIPPWERRLPFGSANPWGD